MHLAFIMDGNRRYAKSHAMETLRWHTRGADRMVEVVEWWLEAGASELSFWALAKKNVEERSAAELAYLYDLIVSRITDLLPKLHAHSIRFEWIGNRDILPEHIAKSLDDAARETADHSAMTLIVGVGYGGQDEIVRAVKRCIQSGVDPESLTEKEFWTYLDSGRFPIPDLIVRTWGDIRHSGYYLYQAEYSEYYFTETLWPDFDRSEFDRALGQFKNAKRNFGK